MFCSQCGTSISPAAGACASCGRLVAGPSAPPSPLPSGGDGLPVPSTVAVTTLQATLVEPPTRLTRVLSAAAYLESEYHTSVLESIIGPSHRAVVSSPGVSSADVIASALHAERRWRQRDMAIAGTILAVALLAGAAFGGPLVLIGTFAGAVVWWVLAAAIGPLLVSLWKFTSGRLRPLRTTVLIALVPSSFFWAPPLLIAGLPYNIGWLVGFALLLSMRGEARQRLLGQRAPAPTDQRGANAIMAARAADESSVTLSGQFLPFVGLGVVRQELSAFTCRVDQAAPRAERSTVSSDALDQALMEGLRRLAIADVTCTQRSFADGFDGHFSTGALSTIPQLLPGLANRIPSGGTDRQRQYIAVQQRLWDDDLVLTSVIRTSLSADTLYVEASEVVLVPLDEWAQTLKSAELHPIRAFLRLVWSSYTEGPWTVAQRWTRAGRWRRARRWAERANGKGFPVDVGALASVRELATLNPDFDRWFQKADAVRFASTVHHAMLRSIDRYLTSCGIDTADFAAKAASVFNETNVTVSSVTGSQIQIAGPGSNQTLTSN